MKLHVIAAMLLVTSVAGLNASDESFRSNTPNLTQLYTALESTTNSNHMHFYVVAGAISEHTEQIKEPRQQKCAVHVLSLMNSMSLTTSPKKRAEYLQKFSNKFAECDQFVPGFMGGQDN